LTFYLPDVHLNWKQKYVVWIQTKHYQVIKKLIWSERNMKPSWNL